MYSCVAQFTIQSVCVIEIKHHAFITPCQAIIYLLSKLAKDHLKTDSSPSPAHASAILKSGAKQWLVWI
jgi:hypothetical protein